MYLGREIYKTTCTQSTTKARYTEQTDPIQMSEEQAWTDGPEYTNAGYSKVAAQEKGCHIFRVDRL